MTEYWTHLINSAHWLATDNTNGMVYHSVSHCEILRGEPSIGIETGFTTYMHMSCKHTNIHMYKYPLSYHVSTRAVEKLSGGQRKPAGGLYKKVDCK